MAIEFFGDFLTARKLVTPAALDEAVKVQRATNVPLGALGLSKGLLTERQVLLIHAEQRRTDRRFGEIAVQKGFLTQTQLDELLREQAEGRVLLGEVLVQMGHLTHARLEDALREYQVEQALAERGTRAALNDVPEPAFATLAAELTVRMVLRMTRQVAKVVSAEALAPDDDGYWLSQAVAGPKPFTLALVLGRDALLGLAAGLLAEVQAAPRDVDELVLDAGKELVNIVVGHLCTRLSQEGVPCMPDPPAAEPGPRGAVAGRPGRWVRVRLRQASGEALQVGLLLRP